jgi:hypothetical protein
MNKVTKSPRLAAMGVAILSGFTLNSFETIMMSITTVPSTRLATEAVITLVPIIVSKFLVSNLSFDINSDMQAMKEAKKPTTID